MTRSSRPTVLDLFAGAGGMALGFEAAGARCVGAVELDAAASRTFARNFAHDEPAVFGGPERGDMTKLSLVELEAALPARPDIIVGGPPCQGFSRIGRAKQRSLLDVEDRVRHGGIRDRGRNELYCTFLDTVQHFEPKAFVMENVPGMREMLGVDIARRIAREAAALRYNLRVFLVNAAWFGVPQQRWRLFFVGLRQDLGPTAIPHAPVRTHLWGPPLPEGMAIPDTDDWIVWGDQIPLADDARPGVTVKEALHDLPSLKGHLDTSLDDRDRKASGEPLPLHRRPSAWAAALRDWPERPAPELVSSNWYRFTSRDFAIFREMAPGDRYPEALEIAHRLFMDKLEQRRRAGDPVMSGSPEYDALRKATIPPYRNDAFHDKWRKLDPSQPSWTVTAHLSRDTYSHIHYSSAQARTITVREAARLQSFPDAFEFEGNFGEQYRQIGNAVPPMLARGIATTLLRQLAELEAPRRRSRRKTAPAAQELC